MFETTGDAGHPILHHALPIGGGERSDVDVGLGEGRRDFGDRHHALLRLHEVIRQRSEDRSAAEALRGARIFLPRSSFPSASKDEYYWVDLIGLEVINREGLSLGTVRDLMTTGPQAVLCVEYQALAEDGTSSAAERMIPFVAAYVDAVDVPGKRITVDWQPDY